MIHGTAVLVERDQKRAEKLRICRPVSFSATLARITNLAAHWIGANSPQFAPHLRLQNSTRRFQLPSERDSRVVAGPKRRRLICRGLKKDSGDDETRTLALCRT